MSEQNPQNIKMKLIKNKNISRTSQACDRCRIKKIKCDGLLPSCSNCLKIGYNCKISDKLTRRAFPRGYTENLERNLIELELQLSAKDDELNRLKKNNGIEDINNDLSNNFFKYNNYIDKNLYLGLNSLQVSFVELLEKHKLPTDFNESKDGIDLPLNLTINEFIINKFLLHFPSKQNLDLILQKYFLNLNKLIPIINEVFFYKNYNEFINNIDSFINVNELIIEKNQKFIVQLILIIQLNCSIFSIHEVHKLISNLSLSNIIVSTDYTVFENLLLSLWLFSNKNCYNCTVISISNILKAMVLNFGLHLNYNNLTNLTNPNEDKEIKYLNYKHRLNLYWCFSILNKLTLVNFGLPGLKFFNQFYIPKLTVDENNDLKYTLKLIELVKSKDWNILKDYSQDYETINFVNNWYDENVTNHKDELNSSIILKQLKLIGLVFKIYLKINLKISCFEFLEEIYKSNLSKEMGFNNFEFHLIPVNFLKIIIISMLHLIEFDDQLSKNELFLIEENISIIKNRYPENFILFKVILNYIQSNLTLIKNRKEKSKLLLQQQSSSEFNQLNSRISSNPHSYESLFQSRSDSTASNSTSTTAIRNHSNSSTLTNTSIESILTHDNSHNPTNYNPKAVDLVDIKNLEWSSDIMNAGVKVEEFSL